MKHIIKFSEPVEFTTWKSAHPDATYADLSSPHYPDSRRTKSVLRKSLCEEQHGLCCYRERRIYPETIILSILDQRHMISFLTYSLNMPIFMPHVIGNQVVEKMNVADIKRKMNLI